MCEWNCSTVNRRFMAEEITTEQQVVEIVCFYFNMRAKSCIRMLLNLVQKINDTQGML